MKTMISTLLVIVEIAHKSSLYKKHTNKAKENRPPVDIIFERDVEMDYFKHVLFSC